MKFTQVPSVRNSNYDWKKIRATLERRPGEWAEIAVGEKSSVANALRDQKIAAMRGVQVQTRNNHFDKKGIRRCDIFVRVPGEDD